MVEDIQSDKGNMQTLKNSQQPFPIQPLQLTKDNADIELYKYNCRCCLLQKGELNIFKTTVENIKLSHMINCISDEQISGTDGLSKKLCEKCLRSIIDVYIFIQRFKTNQEFLKKLIDQPTETENSKVMDDNDIIEIPDIPDDGVQGFVDEFEKENDSIDEFKKKFKRIGPIYKELCDVLVKNKKQLMRLPPSQLARLKARKEEKEKIKQRKEGKEAELPKEGTEENITEPAESSYNEDISDIKDIKTEEAITNISDVTNLNDEKSATVTDLWRLCTSNEVFTTNETEQSTKYEVYTLPSELSSENLKKFANTRLGTKMQEEEEDPDLVMLAPVAQCFECLMVFKTMVDLRKHSLETGHVIPPRYKCRICSKTFKYKRGYKTHKTFHQNVQQDVLCDICGSTVRAANLKRHIMAAHKEGFMCSTCGKSFTQKGKLDRHVKLVHEGGFDDRSLCQFCGMLIYNPWYHTHINEKHKEERTCLPFKCELCDRYFTLEKALTLHKRIHSKTGSQSSFNGLEKVKKRYQAPKTTCPICSKTLQSTNLQVHMNMHRGLKKYECEVCSKRFGQLPHLKTHMNIHLGLKPFKCTYCEKSFRHNTSLVTHVRTHTGETPYVCPVCQKGFAHLTTMKKHTQTHFKTNNVRQTRNVRRIERPIMKQLKEEIISEESSNDEAMINNTHFEPRNIQKVVNIRSRYSAIEGSSEYVEEEFKEEEFSDDDEEDDAYYEPRSIQKVQNIRSSKYVEEEYIKEESSGDDDDEEDDAITNNIHYESRNIGKVQNIQGIGHLEIQPSEEYEEYYMEASSDDSS